MLKRLVTLSAIAGCAGSAPAATYVILPEPGSMTPATFIVDKSCPHDNQIFVCASLNDAAQGRCRLHQKTAH